MARNWIKIETVTPGKPEVCVMATQLRMDPDMVTGKLVRIWSWAEVNRINGNDLGVTREFLDKLAGKKGFAAAMERCGWLKEEDGRLVFPNFQRHNGPNGKGRALTAMRVARHRLRQQKSNENDANTGDANRDSNVTKSMIESDPSSLEDGVIAAADSVMVEETDEPFAGAVAEAEVTNIAETEDDSQRKKRVKIAGGPAPARKVPVAEPPDQPLLFGL